MDESSIRTMKRSESYLTATGDDNKVLNANGKIKSLSLNDYIQLSTLTRVASKIVRKNRLRNIKRRIRQKKREAELKRITVINDQISVEREVTFENREDKLYCNDFLIDNPSVLDSPIHLLWKYKTIKRASSSKYDNKMEVNESSTDNLINTMEEKSNKMNRRSSFFYLKDLICIFLSTIILFSTMFSLEIISILWFNETNSEYQILIAFKMSVLLSNIVIILFLLSASCHSRPLKLILLTPNSTLLLVLVCFLYFSILINLFLSYNLCSKTSENVVFVAKLKIILAVISGGFYSLFCILIINFLCYFSDAFNYRAKLDSIVAGTKSKFKLIKNYQNTFLCYFILFQTNTVYCSIIFLYSLYALDVETVNDQFCSMCSNFMTNHSHSSSNFCPLVSILSLKSYTFDSKPEISSCIPQGGRDYEMHNKTKIVDSLTASVRIKSIEDLYFVVFGLIAFNFFISLFFIFLYISWNSKKYCVDDKLQKNVSKYKGAVNIRVNNYFSISRHHQT